MQNNFVSFVIVGSLSVEDVVPGWSDVDGYLVMNEVTNDVRENVSKMIENVTKQFPFLLTDRGSKFCVIVTSLREMLERSKEVSFLTQWDVERHGVVACGKDITTMLPDPVLDKEWLDRDTDWMFDFLVKEKESPPFWKGVNAICFILNGARNVILKNGAYAKRKVDIARIFAKLYPEKKDTVIRAMDYRSRWLEIQNDVVAVESIYEKAMEFLGWARSLS